MPGDRSKGASKVVDVDVDATPPRSAPSSSWAVSSDVPNSMPAHFVCRVLGEFGKSIGVSYLGCGITCLAETLRQGLLTSRERDRMVYCIHATTARSDGMWCGGRDAEDFEAWSSGDDRKEE